METVIRVVVGLIALVVLWKLLHFLFVLTLGAFHFAFGLVWLALILGAIIFVAGLVRRLMKV